MWREKRRGRENLLSGVKSQNPMCQRTHLFLHHNAAVLQTWPSRLAREGKSSYYGVTLYWTMSRGLWLTTITTSYQ